MPNVEDLFHRALGLPGRDRKAFLAAQCGGDERLRSAVERLLTSDEAAEEQTFWRGSALQAEGKDDRRLEPLAWGRSSVITALSS